MLKYVFFLFSYKRFWRPIKQLGSSTRRRVWKKSNNKKKKKNGVEGIPGRNKKRAILFYPPLSLVRQKRWRRCAPRYTHTRLDDIIYRPVCVCECNHRVGAKHNSIHFATKGSEGGSHTHTQRKTSPKMEGEHMKRMTNWSGKNPVFSV